MGNAQSQSHKQQQAVGTTSTTSSGQRTTSGSRKGRTSIGTNHYKKDKEKDKDKEKNSSQPQPQPPFLPRRKTTRLELPDLASLTQSPPPTQPIPVPNSNSTPISVPGPGPGPVARGRSRERRRNSSRMIDGMGMAGGLGALTAISGGEGGKREAERVGGGGGVGVGVTGGGGAGGDVTWHAPAERFDTVQRYSSKTGRLVEAPQTQPPPPQQQQPSLSRGRSRKGKEFKQETVLSAMSSGLRRVEKARLKEMRIRSGSVGSAGSDADKVPITITWPHPAPPGTVFVTGSFTAIPWRNQLAMIPPSPKGSSTANGEANDGGGGSGGGNSQSAPQSTLHITSIAGGELSPLTRTGSMTDLDNAVSPLTSTSPSRPTTTTTPTTTTSPSTGGAPSPLLSPVTSSSSPQHLSLVSPHTLQILLSPGTHHLKFVVNGEYTCLDSLGTATDDNGNLVNVVEVKPPIGGVGGVPMSPLSAATSSVDMDIVMSNDTGTLIELGEGEALALGPGAVGGALKAADQFWSSDEEYTSISSSESSSHRSHSRSKSRRRQQQQEGRRPRIYRKKPKKISTWTTNPPAELGHAVQLEEDYLADPTGPGHKAILKVIPPAPGLSRWLENVVLNVKERKEEVVVSTSTAMEEGEGGGRSSRRRSGSGSGSGSDGGRRSRDDRERDVTPMERLTPLVSGEGSGSGSLTPGGSGGGQKRTSRRTRTHHHRSHHHPPSPTPLPAYIPTTTPVPLSVKPRLGQGGIITEGQGMGDDKSVLPIPNNVVLNHLATGAIRHGVLACACSVRYRQKFITTVYYKPANL